MSKWWVVLFVAVAGCGEVKSPAVDSGTGSGSGAACTSKEQCSGGTPVCDTAAMECVACLPSDLGACRDTSPICGADRACHACAAHDECSSGVCMPDGSCGDEPMVAFVDGTAAGSATCTRAAPCATFAAALATNRPTIKVRGTVDENVVISRNVVILAEPTGTLKGSGSQTLRITGTSRVAIYDLTVTGTGTSVEVPDGEEPTLFLERVKIQNNGNGGLYMNGGTATVTRSTISNNTGAGGVFAGSGAKITLTSCTIAGNSGGTGVSASQAQITVSRSRIVNNINGGIQVSTGGSFVIVGNVVYNNGQTNSTIGGISIDTTTFGNRLELNTFANNRTQQPATPGINCANVTLAAKSNIFVGNTNSAGGAQTAGTCAHTYTIVTPGAVPVGTANSSMDPRLVDIATGNVHLTAASPARSAGDPASDLSGIAALDIDGDTRANPPDIGADQFKP